MLVGNTIFVSPSEAWLESETAALRLHLGIRIWFVGVENVDANGEKCTDVDSDACQAVGFDNFGGHTKAIQGFKAYNIEGAELTNMGQMSVLGSYPIHFHMCHNTTENGQEHPLIQSNSIHHCFTQKQESSFDNRISFGYTKVFPTRTENSIRHIN